MKDNFKKFGLGNMDIGKKMYTCIGLIVLISFITGAYAVRNIRKLGEGNEELYNGPYKIVNETTYISKNIYSIDESILKAVIKEDTSLLNNNNIFDELDKSIDQLKVNSYINIQQIEQVEKLINDYENLYNKVFVSTDDKNIKKSYDNESSNFENIYISLTQQISQIHSDAQKDTLQLEENIQDRKNTVYRRCWILAISIIILTILVSRYISKNIKNPIIRAESAANEMKIGNFDVDLDYESKDEIGCLFNSLKTMNENFEGMISDIVRVLGEIAKGNFDVEPSKEYVGVFSKIEESLIKITKDLSETMIQIANSSHEVELVSKQVSYGAQELSQGATEQASTVEELTATIVSIANKINNTAKNSSEAREISLSAGNEVENGNNKMKEMILAMEQISSTSNEINRIIKTIDDIAFQTNILALNAAVEAARAGEAGKGFAVVADEVRNLAVKSAEAAKNTTDLIENSINAVNNGTNILRDTAMSLENIIGKVYNSIVLIEDIARDTEEEFNSIKQVSVGIEQVSQVVQTNSATSQESAAASEELSEQARILNLLVDNFKTKNSKKHYENLSF